MIQTTDVFTQNSTHHLFSFMLFPSAFATLFLEVLDLFLYASINVCLC